MHRALLPAALLLQLLFLPALQAQPPQVREVVLENGLKVLLLENHKGPPVTFQVWYRVGARNERTGKTGLSHFLEHMLFKGTPSVAPEEHSRIISKNGGRSNAFTMSDATVYFATMSRDKIGIAIELEADRMVNALLAEDHFEAEKKVVMEERRLRTEDSPASSLSEITSAAAFAVHPYRQPIIGWMEDIRNLSRADLVQYYRTYYVPNNAFLVVVGDFSTEEILAKIKATFGKIPRGPDPPGMSIVEPPQRGERRVLLKKAAELPLLFHYYQTPNLGHPDSFGLDLLTKILAGGRTSRLHRDIVYRKRLAREVDAGYERLSVDPSVFYISAQAMPGRDFGQVERSIDSLLEQIRSEPVGEKELQKAKNQVEAGFIFGQDSFFGQAMRIGRYQLAGGWHLKDRYLEGISKLTSTDLQRIAQQYLVPDRRTVGVLIPTKRTDR